MKRNIGDGDRLARMLVGNVLLLLVMFTVVRGPVATGTFLLGIGLLLTAWGTYCPLYALLGISSRTEAP